MMKNRNKSYLAHEGSLSKGGVEVSLPKTLAQVVVLDSKTEYSGNSSRTPCSSTMPCLTKRVKAAPARLMLDSITCPCCCGLLALKGMFCFQYLRCTLDSVLPFMAGQSTGGRS